MIGTTHASSGLLAGALTAPYAPIPQTPGAQAAWVATCGGMTILNDLDHHSSTIARMWGAPSRVAAAGVGACAGGHRNGTHSLLGVVVFTALALLADGVGEWGRITVVALAIGLALYALTPVIPDVVRIGRRRVRLEDALLAGNVLISWGVAWWLVTHLPTIDTTWLPAAVAVGMVTHIAGDILTKGGVPILWPWRWRFALGLWTTGSRFETAVAAPAFTAAAVLALDHHGLLGVPHAVNAVSRLLAASPWSPQTIDLASRGVAVATVAALVAWLAARDTRAWGMLT